MSNEWIVTTERMPCFRCFGFQTGKTVWYRLNDGSEHEGVYQGWGMFGPNDREDVSHWKPTDDTAISNTDVHIHDHD